MKAARAPLFPFMNGKNTFRRLSQLTTEKAVAFVHLMGGFRKTFIPIDAGNREKTAHFLQSNHCCDLPNVLHSPFSFFLWHMHTRSNAASFCCPGLWSISIPGRSRRFAHCAAALITTTNIYRCEQTRSGIANIHVTRDTSISIVGREYHLLCRAETLPREGGYFVIHFIVGLGSCGWKKKHAGSERDLVAKPSTNYLMTCSDINFDFSLTKLRYISRCSTGERKENSKRGRKPA